PYTTLFRSARARQRRLDVPVLDLAQRRFEVEPVLGDLHGDVLDVSGTPKVGRQPWRIEPVTAAEHEGPLYDVLQLADVARPAVGLEDRERLRRHAAYGPAELRRQAPDEVCHEERDVLPPLAERREMDRDHVQAIEEVLSEHPVSDGLRDLAVRRGDQPHVDLDVARVADAADLALRALLVDRARDELLACATLAGDQHGRDAIGSLADRLEDVEHLRALAEEVLEAALLPQLAFESLVLVLEPFPLERVGDGQLDLVD